MSQHHPHPTLSRRAAIARLGLAGLGLGLVATAAPAVAEEPPRHPLIGHWLAVTPLGPAHLVIEADGGLLMTWPHSEDAEGAEFSYTTSANGFWQSVGDRRIHFAAVLLDTAPGGAVTATTSLDSIIEASENGESFRSAGAAEPVTAWASVGMSRLVLRSEAAEPAISGVRMWPEPVRPE